MSMGAGYAGDITPSDALEKLEQDHQAILVDVRTTAEWESIGVPDLASVQSAPVLIEWLSYPSMAPNPGFVSELKAELDRRGADAETPLLFLCRSGARSGAAAKAMTSLGYAKSYNIAGGFEGSAAQGLSGWRADGLPWKRP
ncbi:rhodanese-like domain-containing protein [Lichenihabitans sp. PAMC28606]|uniref:rhodanese-like domain-containing protein n=1 Tax=Lichenihabitans sp. PAMC28606 TaxID=2880932 RepID=UPI0029CAB553|nr:rhodanese-like domain-containing protein [Lichenihabitans sp. PAMC28606]